MISGFYVGRNGSIWLHGFDSLCFLRRFVVVGYESIENNETEEQNKTRPLWVLPHNSYGARWTNSRYTYIISLNAMRSNYVSILVLSSHFFVR